MTSSAITVTADWYYNAMEYKAFWAYKDISANGHEQTRLVSQQPAIEKQRIVSQQLAIERQRIVSQERFRETRIVFQELAIERQRTVSQQLIFW